jgi:hypothetical protein
MVSLNNDKHPVVTYLNDVLFTVLQEGILGQEPNLSASTYIRNLVVKDFDRRGLLTPDIKDLLVGVKRDA